MSELDAAEKGPEAAAVAETPTAPSAIESADAWAEPEEPEEFKGPEGRGVSETPKSPEDAEGAVEESEASEGSEDPQESEEAGSEESAGVAENAEELEGSDQPAEPEERAEREGSVQSIESVEPEGPLEAVAPDELADPDEASDSGEAEDVNEPDAPSEEDGEAGAPETGDQWENPLADVAEALGERHPEVASVITKLGADDANRLNVIENLKDPEGGGKRTLEIIQELAEGETLEGRSLEEYRSESPGRGPLFEPVEHEVNYEPDGTSRKNGYVEQAKLDDPVRALGASIEDGDRDALDEYGMRLQNEVEPAVYEDVTSLLDEADDAELSIRTKSADGLVDKVNRMTEGSEGRKARPDYEIGDVIDAVGARITVEDTAQLETVLEKSKAYFGTGEDGRLLEVENMYAEPKSGNPSYRVIPMVVAIEVDGKPYTYELQLTTKRASVAADLEHNTVYKSHIETTPGERDVMRRMQAEAAALDQEETRRRHP
ncbi:hypothetical protein ACH470_01480 [Streptomyces bottropensis]|uniref:hypothetical protein n=1 Tax=Streptomyces bottropensis TaxID=42235 RepID=UPI00379387F5